MSQEDQYQSLHREQCLGNHQECDLYWASYFDKQLNHNKQINKNTTKRTPVHFSIPSPPASSSHTELWTFFCHPLFLVSKGRWLCCHLFLELTYSLLSFAQGILYEIKACVHSFLITFLHHFPEIRLVDYLIYSSLSL